MKFASELIGVIVIALLVILCVTQNQMYCDLRKDCADLNYKILCLERDNQVMQDTYNALYLENTELKDSLLQLRTQSYVLNNK